MSTVDDARRARIAAREAGAQDCIHGAPDACERADALYQRAREHGVSPGSPYLLADGRMVMTSRDAWFVESARDASGLQRLSREHELACIRLHESTTAEGEATARAEVLRLERELARATR